MSRLTDRTASGDRALARAVVYRFSSEMLRHPAKATLTEAEWHGALGVALEELDCTELGRKLEECLALGANRADVETEYGRVFGHTPRAGVPLYESEWLGAAGNLLQFHQISDIAAFYKAFGLRLGEECDERVDHISVELSFLHFLCAKEAWAEHEGIGDLAQTARDAQRQFLSEHLARWSPSLLRRITLCSGEGFYAKLAACTREWVDAECRRLGIDPGDPTLAPGETSVTLEDTCMSCAQASSCLPGGVDARDT